MSDCLFFFSPRQTLPLFPTPGMPKQTPVQLVYSQHCYSCYTGLDFPKFPWTIFFPQIVAISVTWHQKRGVWKQGAARGRGCSLGMLQPLLWPPRAHKLGDREGQLQLACPFSLFLLDLLALDLKLLTTSQVAAEKQVPYVLPFICIRHRIKKRLFHLKLCHLN